MNPALEDVPSRRSHVLPIVAVVAATISATVGFQHLVWPSDPVEQGSRGRLATIVGEHRLARARVTGGFAYAPCTIDSSAEKLVRGFTCDGPSAMASASPDKVRKFTTDMRIGEAGASAADLHTAGIWSLAWGKYAEAAANLREATRREPVNARALSDLAVSLTALAQQNDDPSALVEAFVSADSALRADSTLKEARFTHALLLEQLYLRTDAIEAWNRYLRADSKSRWADEARAHLARLQPSGVKPNPARERLQRAVAASDSLAIRSIVAENPSDARLVMHSALGTWGTAFGRDSVGARALLDFARAVAGAFYAVTGDALGRDAVAAIDSAVARGDTSRVRALAEGHASLAKGTDGSRSTVVAVKEASKQELLKARKLLASGGSPMSEWALLQSAVAVMLDPNNPALRWLNAVRDSTPAQYHALRSAAAQNQGWIYDVGSDYVHLLAAYDSALVENRTTREPGITLRVASWLGQAEDVLRGKRAGWRTRYAALAATPSYPTNYRALFTVFDYAAMATATDAPRLSLRYSDESIRIARAASDTLSLAYALRRRAELLAALGQLDRARADIAVGLDALKHVEGQSKLVADVTLAGAHIEMHSAVKVAEEQLRGVVQEYKALKYEKGLPSAYLYLAQARAALGAIDSARASFDSATSLMQRQRATVANYAERGAFLDDARLVIDQIVAFQADHGGKDAFEYFEGTRSRVLLEQLAQRGSAPASHGGVLPELQRRLGSDDVVLSYAVLPRELLVWTIGRNRFEQRRVSVAATDLEDLVTRFQRSVLDATGEPDADMSQRLYSMLLGAPDAVPPGANLIIVPDRWLHFVPFVALRDPSNGRFLVRDHAVSYAPSATLLLSSLAHAPTRFSRATRVLAIGNPAFDRRAFQFPDLPAAGGEASRIASLYGLSPLTGRDATDAALERAAPGFEIIHFAGHAVVGRDAPQLSHLVLASEGRSDGAVFSTEIAKWKLPRTRLVILSGCSTADGKLSATEGASSLARAFFSAGVPAVVSSLWAIEDEDTADFFLAFHRRLVQGDPPAVALRETQIAWLADGAGHPVRSWAAFQLFGG